MMRYICPKSPEEAVRSAVCEDGVFCAGGSDLLARLRYETCGPAALVDVMGLGLARMWEDEAGIHIGAGVTMTAALQSGLLDCAPYSLLRDALLSVGSWQTRNVATLAGALCVGRRGADVAAAAVALEARLYITDPQGQRCVDAQTFCAAPIRQSQPKGTLVREVVLARGKMARVQVRFRRVSVRKASAAPLFCVAAVLDAAARPAFCRLAVGAVAEGPIRLRAVERIWCERAPHAITAGEIAESLAADLAPCHGSAYQRAACGNVLARIFREHGGALG